MSVGSASPVPDLTPAVAGKRSNLSQLAQFEKLFKGQQRLEAGLLDVQQSLDRLTAALHHDLTGDLAVDAETRPLQCARDRFPSMEIVAQPRFWRSFTTPDAASLASTDADNMKRGLIGGGRVVSAATMTPVVAACSSFIVHPQLESVAQTVCLDELVEWDRLGSSIAIAGRTTTSSEPHSDEGLGLLAQRTSRTRFVVHPASSFNTMLDVLRMLFMTIDVIVVPYVIAWDVALSGSFYTLVCVIMSFWTLDLLFNLRTGYISGGMVILRPRSILIHYLRTGFSFDVLVLSVDYLEVMEAAITGESHSFLKGFRVLRGLRLIRLVVKLRAGLLARLKTALFQTLQLRGLGRFAQSIELAILMAKVFVLIAWLGHMGSCIWFALLRNAPESHSEPWQEYDTGCMGSYMRGLYWAVSTMFAGASPVLPRNTAEGMLSVLWIALGAVFLTSVTSTLAASLIEIHSKQQEMSKKVQTLSSFLAQCNAPSVLAVAVRDDFNRKVLEPKPVSEVDLPLLQLVKPSLRAALRLHQYAAAFKKSDIVRLLAVMKEPLLQQLCFSAAAVISIPSGSQVFDSGDEVEHAYLLAQGFVEYTLMPSGIPLLNRREAEVERFLELETDVIGDGAWLCEYALLFSWRATGTAVAQSVCEIVDIPAEEFIKVVMPYPHLAAFTAQYAVELSKRYTALPRFSLEGEYLYSDINPGIDSDEVIADMHVSMRGLLSMPQLQLLRQNQSLFGELLRGRKAFVDLESEVLRGVCHVSMGAEGLNSIRRVVRVVFLRLINQDGLLCAQIAQAKGGGPFTPKFGLPGRKVASGQTPETAITMVIEEQMHSVSHAISPIQQVETVTETVHSAAFDMNTKYIKTIFEVKLLGHCICQYDAQPETSCGMYRHDSPTDLDEHLQAATKRHTSRTAPSPMRFPTGLGSTHLPAFLGQFGAELGEQPADDGQLDHTTLLCGEALHGDGQHHGFTVGALSTTQGAQATHEDEREAKYRTSTYLYRWLSQEQYDNLSARRAEVEQSLSSSLRHLTQQHWQKVSSWRVCADAAVDAAAPSCSILEMDDTDCSEPVTSL